MKKAPLKKKLHPVGGGGGMVVEGCCTTSASLIPNDVCSIRATFFEWVESCWLPLPSLVTAFIEYAAVASALCLFFSHKHIIIFLQIFMRPSICRLCTNGKGVRFQAFLTYARRSWVAGALDTFNFNRNFLKLC